MRIDIHCHVFRELNSLDVLKKLFNQFQDYGFYKRILNKMENIKTLNTNNIIEKTIFHVKKAEIDKVVLLPLSIKENDLVLKWAQLKPDIFIPFFNPPERQTDDESVEELVERKILEDGIKGLKIMLPFRKKKLNDRIIFQALNVAVNYDIPVLMHSGYPPPGTTRNVLTYSNPLQVDDIISSFSHLKLILAHMGYPWTDIAFALTVQYPNIYLDISNLTYMMPNRLKELLIRAREMIGLHKILFGTDGFTPEMIEIAAQYFNEVNFLNREEIDKIMGHNAKILFNI